MTKVFINLVFLSVLRQRRLECPVLIYGNGGGGLAGRLTPLRRTRHFLNRLRYNVRITDEDFALRLVNAPIYVEEKDLRLGISYFSSPQAAYISSIPNSLF